MDIRTSDSDTCFHRLRLAASHVSPVIDRLRPGKYWRQLVRMHTHAKKHLRHHGDTHGNNLTDALKELTQIIDDLMIPPFPKCTSGESPSGGTGENLGATDSCESTVQPRSRERGTECQSPALADAHCPGRRRVRRAVNYIRQAYEKGDLHGKDRSLQDAEEVFERYLRSRSATTEAIRKTQPRWKDGTSSHVMHSPCGKRTIVMFMVDTGADVYSIPQALLDGMGPMSQRGSQGVVHGVSGEVKALFTEFLTPFGPRKGLVNRHHLQSLMPGKEFSRNGYLHIGGGTVAVTCYRGIRTTLLNLGNFTYAPFLFQEGKVVLLNHDEWHLHLEPVDTIHAPRDYDRRVQFESANALPIELTPEIGVIPNNTNSAKATAAPRRVRCIVQRLDVFCRATHSCDPGGCWEPQCFSQQKKPGRGILRLTQKNEDGHVERPTSKDKKISFAATKEVMCYYPREAVTNIYNAGAPGWSARKVDFQEYEGPRRDVPLRVFVTRANTPRDRSCHCAEDSESVRPASDTKTTYSSPHGEPLQQVHDTPDTRPGTGNPDAGTGAREPDTRPGVDTSD